MDKYGFEGLDIYINGHNSTVDDIESKEGSIGLWVVKTVQVDRIQNHFVVTSVCFLTITAWWFQYSGGDALLDWILTIGMIAMTLILIFHLPDILDSMSDENLAEDLNIQENNNLK